MRGQVFGRNRCPPNNRSCGRNQGAAEGRRERDEERIVTREKFFALTQRRSGPRQEADRTPAFRKIETNVDLRERAPRSCAGAGRSLRRESSCAVKRAYTRLLSAEPYARFLARHGPPPPRRWRDGHQSFRHGSVLRRKPRIVE